MSDCPSNANEQDSLKPDRRTVLSTVSSLAMAGGLIGSYGTLAAIAGRFLYPAKPQEKGWMFVSEVAKIKPGSSLAFRTPAGATIAITRQADSGTIEDFIALSNVCPHLGCQVHWEAQNNRFFCPCHNGAFDSAGKAISGPPADEGQFLPSYPLKLEKGLLYIEVPLTNLA